MTKKTIMPEKRANELLNEIIDYIKGYTKALIDVKRYIENHEYAIKKTRLTGYTGILKLLDAVIAGREELRETGNLMLIKTSDGRVIPQSDLKNSTGG